MRTGCTVAVGNFRWKVHLHPVIINNQPFELFANTFHKFYNLICNFKTTNGFEARKKVPNN